MVLLAAVMIITRMTHRKYADQAHDIRAQLTKKIAGEAAADPAGSIPAWAIGRKQSISLWSAQGLRFPVELTVRESTCQAPLPGTQPAVN